VISRRHGCGVCEPPQHPGGNTWQTSHVAAPGITLFVFGRLCCFFLCLVECGEAISVRAKKKLPFSLLSIYPNAAIFYCCSCQKHKSPPLPVHHCMFPWKRRVVRCICGQTGWSPGLVELPLALLLAGAALLMKNYVLLVNFFPQMHLKKDWIDGRYVAKYRHLKNKNQQLGRTCYR